MFDLFEESFDQIALAVEGEVAQALDRPVFLGRNDGSGTALDDEINDRIAVISLVPQRIFGGDTW